MQHAGILVGAAGWRETRPSLASEPEDSTELSDQGTNIALRSLYAACPSRCAAHKIASRPAHCSGSRAAHPVSPRIRTASSGSNRHNPRSFDRAAPVVRRLRSIEHVSKLGRLNVPDPIATVDGLLAATAIVQGLTLVSRNVKDVARTGARLLNPFAG